MCGGDDVAMCSSLHMGSHVMRSLYGKVSNINGLGLIWWCGEGGLHQECCTDQWGDPDVSWHVLACRMYDPTPYFRSPMGLHGLMVVLCC